MLPGLLHLGFDRSRIGQDRGPGIAGAIVGDDMVLAGPHAFQRPLGDLCGQVLGAFTFAAMSVSMKPA